MDIGNIPTRFFVWSADELNCLSCLFDTKEVHKALFDMSPFKAPRPGGFQPFFLAYVECGWVGSNSGNSQVS